MNKIILASRGSKLAMWQANHVMGLLTAGESSVEILEIQTTGDRVQDRFLHEIGGKGVFIKELEVALKDGRAHVAVHSLKDLPAKLVSGFALPAFLPRHSVRDLLILNPKFKDQHKSREEGLSLEAFKELKLSSIATGSLRRQALLRKYVPNIETVPIRGNVDTRLAKLEREGWDGLILAEASLDRLQIKQNYLVMPFDPSWFIPSPSQGALAIETRADYKPMGPLVRLNCRDTAKCVQVERKVLELLGGDCTMPFGCYLQMAEPKCLFRAIVLTQDGQHSADIELELKRSLSFEHMLDKIMKGLIDNGVVDILKRLGIKVQNYYLDTRS